MDSLETVQLIRLIYSFRSLIERFATIIPVFRQKIFNYKLTKTDVKNPDFYAP